MAHLCVQIVTHFGVDHEAQHILDAVKGHDASVDPFPHVLPVGTAALNQRPHPVDELWVCDGDLEEGRLLVSLEAKQILPQHDLHGRDDGLVLSEMALEMLPEAVTVTWLEFERSSDVEIVEEVGDVKKDRVP